MKKRVIIAHGWEGYPEEGWFPWLKKELEQRDFEVIIPQLPDPENPRIYNWVPKLSGAVGNIDENTYFVGHSMGCQTIARLLEKQPDSTKAGGAVFVAGFFKRLAGLGEDDASQETGEHWFQTPLDFQKVRRHLPKSIAIFSDDDPWVPLDNQEDFCEKLGSEIIIEHYMGHFSGARDKVFELPIALEALLKITGK